MRKVSFEGAPNVLQDVPILLCKLTYLRSQFHNKNLYKYLTTIKTSFQPIKDIPKLFSNPTKHQHFFVMKRSFICFRKGGKNSIKTVW